MNPRRLLPALPAEVTVQYTTVSAPFGDCEYCGTEHTGCIGVYWPAQEATAGLVYCCPDCLLRVIRDAQDDAPCDAPITVEIEVHAQPMLQEVAA